MTGIHAGSGASLSHPGCSRFGIKLGKGWLEQRPRPLTILELPVLPAGRPKASSLDGRNGHQEARAHPQWRRTPSCRQSGLDGRMVTLGSRGPPFRTVPVVRMQARGGSPVPAGHHCRTGRALGVFVRNQVWRWPQVIGCVREHSSGNDSPPSRGSCDSGSVFKQPRSSPAPPYAVPASTTKTALTRSPSTDRRPPRKRPVRRTCAPYVHRLADTAKNAPALGCMEQTTLTP